MGRIERREFLVGAGALIAAPLARGQAGNSPRVLGILSLGRKPPPESEAYLRLLARLRELG